MGKVYAVNSGCYSAFNVDAIFTTKEKAQEYMNFVQDSSYNEILEYDLDTDVCDRIKRGQSVWRVQMLVDGTVEKVCRQENEKYVVSDIRGWIWKRTKAAAYKGKGIPDCLVNQCWARNEKHAIKITNEKRTQMLASGEWEES